MAVESGPVTVVVATRNRAVELEATLERLRALPEEVPVVVVDNASDDNTVERVRQRHPQVQVVELQENLGAAARTVGVLHANSRYVAFSDDDSWWAPGSLQLAVEMLDRHPRLAVLAARVLVGPEERLDPVCAAMASSPLEPVPDLPGPAVLGFVACGAVVRRSAFLQVDGFQRRFGLGCEEGLLAVDLAAAGWGLAYVDEVVAYHYPSPHRDRRGRRRTQVRNELWSIWLRRPLGVAARSTLRTLVQALPDPSARVGVVQALRLLESGKAAIVATVNSQIDSLSERLQKRAESLRQPSRPSGTAEEEEEAEQPRGRARPEEQADDEEDEEDYEADYPQDEEPEPIPERPVSRRGQRQAGPGRARREAEEPAAGLEEEEEEEEESEPLRRRPAGVATARSGSPPIRRTRR